LSFSYPVLLLPLSEESIFGCIIKRARIEVFRGMGTFPPDGALECFGWRNGFCVA
jgi:hypothetical protein